MSRLIQSSVMACANTFAFSGIEAVPVEVQVQIAPGAPALLLVGMADKAVAEARERVRAAFSAMGLSLPPKRVLINLKPADLLKEGSHFDLPLALALLAAMEVLPREDIGEYAALGELSLDGSLNPVAGVLPAAIGASAHDLGLICPAGQGGEAAWAGRIDVLAPPDLLSLINHFRGAQVLTPPAPSGRADSGPYPDMRDVKGMESAKRVLEIAAAGGHNLLLIGPPGAGKSMLAARLPGLLPDLDPRSALEYGRLSPITSQTRNRARFASRPVFVRCLETTSLKRRRSDIRRDETFLTAQQEAAFLAAEQEAAAAAQAAQRAIEVDPGRDQRAQRHRIARHAAQHLAQVDIAIGLDRGHRDRRQARGWRGR